MEVTIEEGRFTEVPTANATGMERRAFGEFVGVHGELASYAFGWTTGADPHVAHMTIGIGAGNPGGATFHAVLFVNDDSFAYALDDEPFEQVPQGGPDLTAEEARAHDDIAFIWAVADTILERDRRARWMIHWLMGTSAIQTPQVFELEEPILLVANDDADDLWQLIGPTDAGDDDGTISHLYHAVDADPTLLDVLDLMPGEEAERERVGGEWTRGPSPPDDE